MTRQDWSAELETFAMVYEREHDRTVRLAWLLTGDRGEAQEIAHDAWVNAYRRDQRRPVDNLVPYVRTSVVNGARDRGRRGVLEGAFLRAARRERPPNPDEPSQVGQRMVLTECLQALAPRMRTAVVLRFYLDLSVRDTATLMGVSEGTVKSSVSKGLARLRTMWKEQDDD